VRLGQLPVLAPGRLLSPGKLGLARSTWRTAVWLLVRPLLAAPAALLLVGFLELGVRGVWVALSLVMLAAGVWLGVSTTDTSDG
jgi:hypothetical protein